MSGDLSVYGLMSLNAGACLFYAWEGAGYKALYWASVIVLNFSLLKLK